MDVNDKTDDLASKCILDRGKTWTPPHWVTAVLAVVGAFASIIGVCAMCGIIDVLFVILGAVLFIIQSVALPLIVIYASVIVITAIHDLFKEELTTRRLALAWVFIVGAVTVATGACVRIGFFYNEIATNSDAKLFGIEMACAIMLSIMSIMLGVADAVVTIEDRDWRCPGIGYKEQNIEKEKENNKEE